MTKPRTKHKSVSKSSPLVAVLKNLVVPAFEELMDPTYDGLEVSLMEPEPESETAPSIHSILRGGHVVQVRAAPTDNEGTILSFSLLIGYFLTDRRSTGRLIRKLLGSTPFRVRSDTQSALLGGLSAECDLIVHPDDAPLVRHRLSELVRLADDLTWFFPLRLATRFGWQDLSGFEIDPDDLPTGKLSKFLDEGLAAPSAEQPPLTLLQLARGLGRWQDVLRVLHDHPDALPPYTYAPMKCMAYRELRLWQPAIRAAAEGEIKDGRYPGRTLLSPTYVYALIESGDDIEALRFLGKPNVGEPGFYGWLRGLALYRAGDFEQASKAFSLYFSKWPGDVLGAAITDALVPNE